MSQKIIAHRGGNALKAPNSWQAIRRSVADGADLIEVDVQMSIDGVALILHPYALPSGRMVQRALANEIADEVPGIVLLSELLDWFSSSAPTTGLVLDLKNGFGAGPAMAEAVADQVAAHGLTEQVIMGGWDHPTLVALRARHPKMRTMAFVRGRPVDLAGMVQDAQVNSVALSYDLVTASDVAALHAINVEVAVVDLWHLDVDLVTSVGADLICVDDVSAAIEAFRCQSATTNTMPSQT